MRLSGQDKEKITNYFRGKPEIAAVYLYGSQAKGGASRESDVDLGVLVGDKKSFSGFDFPQTRYCFELEKLIRKKVEIQDLESIAVDFAHRVISEGELLLGIDSDRRVEFEERVLRVYFDMKPAIDEYFYHLRKIAKKGELNVGYI